MKMVDISDDLLRAVLEDIDASVWLANRRRRNMFNESLGRPGDNGITESIYNVDVAGFRQAVAGIEFYPFEMDHIYWSLLSRGVELLHDDGSPIKTDEHLTSR